MEIRVFNKIPKAALEAISNDAEEQFNSLEDVVDYIVDMGDHEDSKDSCYINHTYTHDVKNWRFIATSSQYLKDGGICEDERDEEIEVINLDTLKKVKDKLQEENKKKWKKFLTKASTEEILEKVAKVKFK